MRSCSTCSKPLRGRSDKKYCDDYCRNTFNNHQKLKGINGRLVRSINSALLKNRKILESLLPAGEENIKVHREKLLALGFHFRYSTQSYLTRAGKTYYYCYDFGYLPLENDWYLLVRKKEDQV